MGRSIRDHKSYLAKVYMAQILWSGQKKTLPSRFFHNKTGVAIPGYFSYVKLRTILQNMEIAGEGGCVYKLGTGTKFKKAESLLMTLPFFVLYLNIQYSDVFNDVHRHLP